MKCYNCKCDLVIVTDDNHSNIDTNKIATKYKDFDLCSFCKESLIYFGFLGDIDEPLITYEKEKIKLKKKKK